MNHNNANASTDRPMWLNSGRFLDNGRSGYVLKPLVMTSGTFNPFRHETYSGIVDGVTLRIRVCSWCIHVCFALA